MLCLSLHLGLRLDEDALPGALFGGFDHGVELRIGKLREAFDTARFREDLVAFLDVGQAVVEKREDIRSDLFAEPVTGAQILIDPDLHRVPTLPMGQLAGIRADYEIYPVGARPARHLPATYCVRAG